MRNRHLAFQIVGLAIRRRAVTRWFFAAAVMLSASTAVVHAREVSENTEIRPGHTSMRAPVSHRQPTRRDVARARPGRSDKKIVVQDNALIDPAASLNNVADTEEDALTRMIDEGNLRIDRLIRNICRGC